MSTVRMVDSLLSHISAIQDTGLCLTYPPVNPPFELFQITG